MNLKKELANLDIRFRALHEEIHAFNMQMRIRMSEISRGVTQLNGVLIENAKEEDRNEKKVKPEAKTKPSEAPAIP